MRKITYNGKVLHLEYKQTKIGDTVYDFGTERTYVASIMDADDYNWVVVMETY